LAVAFNACNTDDLARPQFNRQVVQRADSAGTANRHSGNGEHNFADLVVVHGRLRIIDHAQPKRCALRAQRHFTADHPARECRSVGIFSQ
jgi:hypothetical protein